MPAQAPVYHNGVELTSFVGKDIDEQNFSIQTNHWSNDVVTCGPFY